jgi:hypothetical protein
MDSVADHTPSIGCVDSGSFVVSHFVASDYPINRPSARTDDASRRGIRIALNYEPLNDYVVRSAFKGMRDGVFAVEYCSCFTNEYVPVFWNHRLTPMGSSLEEDRGPYW